MAVHSVFKLFTAYRRVHKRRLANIIMHLPVTGAHEDSIYTGLCGASASAKAQGSALVARYAQLFTTSLASRETWYAAGAARKLESIAISQHPKIIPKRSRALVSPVLGKREWRFQEDGAYRA